MGQHADLGISKDRAAYHVMMESTLNTFTEWLFDEHLPGRAGVGIGKAFHHVLPRYERFKQCGPYVLCQKRRHVLEALKIAIFLVAARETSKRLLCLCIRCIANQQGDMLTVADRRCEGCHGPTTCLKVQSQIVHNFLREQADKIRIN